MTGTSAGISSLVLFVFGLEFSLDAELEFLVSLRERCSESVRRSMIVRIL